MLNATRIGRLGMLAVGLGIGAALAATPGVASADPSSDPFSWIDQLLGGLSVSAPAATLDMQISIDGTDLLPTAGNTATATSGTNDIAIAIGNGSAAEAGDKTFPGQFDFAFANGASSSAIAGIGNFDTALANGTTSGADVGGDLGILSNGDFGSAFGADTVAVAGVLTLTPSANDIAMVFDPFGSLGGDARAGDGNFDLASIFGDNSIADAHIGSNDLAEVFGNGLHSITATGMNFISDILTGPPF